MFLNIGKSTTISIGDGAIYSLVAMVMVFAILLIIIGVTTLVFKLTGLFEMKKELDALKNNANAPAIAKAEARGPVEIKDDDMMAAVLVATIDYQNEIKKDVRVVSVKEI